MKLRPYQQRALDRILAGFRTMDRLLLVAATGAGKTIIFCKLAEMVPEPKRVLILCHRKELVTQAMDKLKSATGHQAARYGGGGKVKHGDRFVVSTIQAMHRAIQKPDAPFPPGHFRLVIADEAHHSTSQQWQDVLGYWTGAKILGVTATPTDKLDDYYQATADKITIRELIASGHLAPLRIRILPTQIDLRSVGMKKGDYDPKKAAEAVEPALRAVIEGMAKYASDRRTIVFLPLVRTSQIFVKLCKEAGIKAAHVDGESKDRESILQRFRAGEFQVLANSSLLLEGYDDPAVDCVCVLRPTQSQILYTQAVGRGLRLHPGKRNCLVLDALMLCQNHNLMNPARIITDEAIEPLDSIDMDRELSVEEYAEQLADQRERRLARAMSEYADRESLEFDPMDFTPTEPWETEPATDKQLAKLKKWGVPLEGVTIKGYASMLIEKITEHRDNKPASHRMLYALRKRGIQLPPGTTTKEARKCFARTRS